MPPKMPESTLKELVAANIEAQDTLRQMHEARANLLDIDKKQRERITTLIVQEVTDQVGELGKEARQQMSDKINEVIEGITTDWRMKLGLP